MSAEGRRWAVEQAVRAGVPADRIIPLAKALLAYTGRSETRVKSGAWLSKERIHYLAQHGREHGVTALTRQVNTLPGPAPVTPGVLRRWLVTHGLLRPGDPDRIARMAVARAGRGLNGGAA